MVRLLILAACLLTFPAFAEETALPAAPSSFGSGNAQLQDVLELQHQIQLLKRLVDRETAVNNVASAGRDIGMKKPLLSKPERELCASVPANIPCAQAYADIYPDFDVKPVAELQALPPVKKAEAPKIKKAEVSVPATPSLYWLDITCLEESCSALVASNPNDAKTRKRVRAGDVVEGNTIRAISASGIMLERNGKAARVLPAPRG